MGLRCRIPDMIDRWRRQAEAEAARAEAARAEAARAAVERGNRALGSRRGTLWSPTIRAAVLADMPWLDVYCPRLPDFSRDRHSDRRPASACLCRQPSSSACAARGKAGRVRCRGSRACIPCQPDNGRLRARAGIETIGHFDKCTIPWRDNSRKQWGGLFWSFEMWWTTRRCQSLVRKCVCIFVLCVAVPGSGRADDVRIKSSPGGEVFSYLRFFGAVRASGDRVVIDGPCLSACTLVLSVVPRNRICVTRRAVLGFHAPVAVDESGQRYAFPGATRIIAGTYPAPIRQWIRRHGGLSGRMILLSGRELAAMYAPCT
jgi:hypothetical protein